MQIDIDLIIRVVVSIVLPAVPVIIAWRSLPAGMLQKAAETKRIESNQKKEDAEALAIMIKSSTDLITNYKDISKHFEDRYEKLEQRLIQIEEKSMEKEAEIRRLHKILICLTAGIKRLIEQMGRLNEEPSWTIPDAIQKEIEKEQR